RDPGPGHPPPGPPAQARAPAPRAARRGPRQRGPAPGGGGAGAVPRTARRAVPLGPPPRGGRRHAAGRAGQGSEDPAVPRPTVHARRPPRALAALQRRPLAGRTALRLPLPPGRLFVGASLLANASASG